MTDILTFFCADSENRYSYSCEVVLFSSPVVVVVLLLFIVPKSGMACVPGTAVLICS